MKRPDDEALDPATRDKRRQQAEESLLDDERLRSNLTDDEFQPLLDWAIKQADAAADATGSIKNEEQAAEVIAQQMAAIRSFLRSLNNLFGGSSFLPAAELSTQLVQVQQQLYGSHVPANSSFLQRILAAAGINAPKADVIKRFAAILPDLAPAEPGDQPAQLSAPDTEPPAFQPPQTEQVEHEQSSALAEQADAPALFEYSPAPAAPQTAPDAETAPASLPDAEEQIEWKHVETVIENSAASQPHAEKQASLPEDKAECDE